MTLLKPKELRTMRPEDIRSKFKELTDELMHERGVAAMGGAPASPGKLRALRTNIARIHTVMREQELAKKIEATVPTKEERAKEKKTEPKAAPKPKEKKERIEKKAAENKPVAKNEEEKK